MGCNYTLGLRERAQKLAMERLLLLCRGQEARTAWPTRELLPPVLLPWAHAQGGEPVQVTVDALQLLERCLGYRGEPRNTRRTAALGRSIAAGWQPQKGGCATIYFDAEGTIWTINGRTRAWYLRGQPEERRGVPCWVILKALTVAEAVRPTAQVHTVRALTPVGRRPGCHGS